MIKNSDIAKLKGWIPVTKIMLGKTHINGWIDKSEDNFVITLPDWTHNIADAWGLVEEAESDPQKALFSMTRKSNRLADDLRWFAYFRNCMGNQHDYWAEADTAPQAIVEAYAKWRAGK